MSTCMWQHHLALSIPVFQVCLYGICHSNICWNGALHSWSNHEFVKCACTCLEIQAPSAPLHYSILTKKASQHDTLLHDLHSWICLKNGGLWVQQEILVHTELIMNLPSKCAHNPHLWLSRVPHSYQTLHELTSEFLYYALPGGAGFVRDERYGTREAIEVMRQRMIKSMYQLFITATVSQTYQNKDRMKQVFVKAHQPGQ